MATTIVDIRDCLGSTFSLFSCGKPIPTGALRSQSQRNSNKRGGGHLTERQLLPFFHLALALRFGRGQVSSEVSTSAPWKGTGKGKLDFVVDGVAVEIAVRNKGGTTSWIAAKTNETEVKKLLTCEQRRGVLALFDFTNHPLCESQLAEFRHHPPLPKGDAVGKPYNLMYFFIDDSADQGWSFHHLEIRR